MLLFDMTKIIFIVPFGMHCPFTHLYPLLQCTFFKKKKEIYIKDKIIIVVPIDRKYKIINQRYMKVLNELDYVYK